MAYKKFALHLALLFQIAYEIITINQSIHPTTQVAASLTQLCSSQHLRSSNHEGAYFTKIQITKTIFKNVILLIIKSGITKQKKSGLQYVCKI